MGREVWLDILTFFVWCFMASQSRMQYSCSLSHNPAFDDVQGFLDQLCPYCFFIAFSWKVEYEHAK